MTNIKRLKSHRPPAGTKARQIWQEKLQGFRFRSLKGSGVVKEYLDRKTGNWSRYRATRLFKGNHEGVLPADFEVLQ